MKASNLQPTQKRRDNESGEAVASHELESFLSLVLLGAFFFVSRVLLCQPAVRRELPVPVHEFGTPDGLGEQPSSELPTKDTNE